MSPWLLLTRVQLIFLKWCCENLSLCNLILGEQQWKYIYSPANSPSPKDNIFLTVTGNKFIARNYHFSDPNNIYLFKLSNSSIIKDKTCSKLTTEGPDFILVSSLFTLNISDRLFEWYLLTLNLMHFSVRSRCLVTFNTKLYITTVNNSFLPLTIFCHKELHLRCCMAWTEYCNIYKNSKRYWDLEKIWKTNPLQCLESFLP